MVLGSNPGGRTFLAKNFFFKNELQIQNQDKIAVILSINTLVGQKKPFLVILGHFWSFLAILGILGVNLGPSGDISDPTEPSTGS